MNIALGNPTNGLTLASQSSTVLTIIDDDTVAPMPGSIALTNAAYNVAENGGTATIFVTRTGGSTGAVAVNFATGGGTAQVGTKYTATSGTLNWADGDTATKSFTIPINDNQAVDGDKTVGIALSNATNGVTFGSPSTATLTIVDDDVAPPKVQLSSGPTATPNPAAVNTPVMFTCVATGTAPVLIAWDFGDGGTLAASATTTVSHTYTTPGIKTVKVTASDSVPSSTEGQIDVTINPPPPQAMTVTHGALKLDFKKHNDTFKISGALPLGGSFVAAGVQSTVAIGTLSKPAALNGSARLNEFFKLGKAPKKDKTATAPVPFTFTIKNQDLLSALSTFGFA